MNIQKKSRKQQAKPVDTATPVIRKPKNTDIAKVAITRSITTAMKAAPQWTTNPAIQAAATAWGAAADAVESNATAITDLRKRIATAEASQRANRQDWRVATKQVTALVTVVCQGSPDQVHALGFDVLTHVPAAPQPAPGGLVTLPGTVAGEAVVRWQRGNARNGFVVQHAADPATPAFVSLPIPCTKTKYKLEGAQSASTVHFRVAAIDTTSSAGMGPWSDWVACTVG